MLLFHKRFFQPYPHLNDEISGQGHEKAHGIGQYQKDAALTYYHTQNRVTTNSENTTRFQFGCVDLIDVDAPTVVDLILRRHNPNR
jgi:hypothetical protein